MTMPFFKIVLIVTYMNVLGKIKRSGHYIYHIIKYMFLFKYRYD